MPVALKALSSAGFAWVRREVFAARFYSVGVVVAATGFSPGPGPSRERQSKGGVIFATIYTN